MAVLERRRKIRRFLEGLSSEELRYIAGYLGACLIESTLAYRSVPRAQIACQILRYEGYPVCEDNVRWNTSQEPRASSLEHRMILLLEYLNSCQCAVAVKVAAGSA